MKAYLLSDGEYATARFDRLNALVKRVLTDRGFELIEKQLAPGELDYCVGCFGCWVKTPGECVIRDSMGEINRAMMNCDVAVYLTPVVFGQYSANIKNAVDRWIPNILPFFITRENGDTIHPARYRHNPRMVMIGYGEGLTAEDMEIFKNITHNHRDNGAALIYEGDDGKTERELLAAGLERTGAVL